MAKKDKLNVVIMCSISYSAGAMCDAVKRVLEKQGLDDQINVNYYPLRQVNPEALNKFDLVAFAPNVRHLAGQATKMCQDKGIPCWVIDFPTFGTLDGEKFLEQIEEHRKKIKK